MANGNTIWITPAEAAEMIGLTVGHLANWRSSCKEGQPKFYKTGSLVRYKKTDIEEWIETTAVSY